MPDPMLTLTEDLRRDQAEQKRRSEEARLRAANMAQEDPAKARRILSIQTQTGLPEQLISADLDNIEQQLIRDQFDYDKYRKESPAWTSFAAENPYHLAVLKDDMEDMGRFERSIKQIGMGWDQTWATVEVGRLRHKEMNQGGELDENDRANLLKYQEMLVDHEYGAEGLAAFLVKNAKMAGPTLYSMERGLEGGLGGAMVGATAALIAGQAGPQIATPEEVATVPAAALTGFKIGAAAGTATAAYELESGFAYGEYRDMGVDHNTAMVASQAVGVVNASLESIGIGKAAKYVPWLRESGIGNKLTANVLTKPSMQRATGMAMLRFGEVLGTEVVTESIQEAVTIAGGQIIRPDGTEAITMDQFTDRIVDTALETLQGAAIMSSLGPSMSYYSDMRMAQNAKQMTAVYEALGDAAKNSKTRKNLKAKYNQFVERLTENSAVKNILIDAEQFDRYFQEQGQDPNAVAESLGVDLDQLAEAREIGGDVEIGITQYASQIAGTEAHNGLIKDLKTDTQPMSLREAEMFEKNNPDFVKMVEEDAAQVTEVEADAETESIVQDVVGQLVAANVSPSTANQVAQVIRGIPTLAKRMGMNQTELFEQVFGGVKRVTPEALSERQDVDMLMDPLLDRLRNNDFPSQMDMFGPSLMDLISEAGGINVLDPELEARDFALGAQDIGVSKSKLDRWAKDGRGLDDIAEIAAEAGYIAARDENLLLEAIDREIRGEPVYGAMEAGDAGLRDVSNLMNELAQFIDEAGLDLETMSNAEIREAMQNRMTLNQIDTKELKNLTEIVVSMAKAEEVVLTSGTQPDQIDGILAKAAAMLPDVFEAQDFGDLAFADTVRVQETGETVEVTEPAQRKFDRAIKRRNVLKKLKDCVSG